MTYSILRLSDVCSKTGLSRSTIYERQKANSFPQSVSLGSRAVGFISTEIDEWIESRINESRGIDSNVKTQNLNVDDTGNG